MKLLAKTFLAGKAASSAATLAGRSTLLSAGAGALAARWAMRSIPAALGVLAAGAAARHLLRRRRAGLQPLPPAAPQAA